jgi:hypothetical protein
MVCVGESAACAFIDPAKLSAIAPQTLKYVVRMVDDMMAPFFAGGAVCAAPTMR